MASNYKLKMICGKITFGHVQKYVSRAGTTETCAPVVSRSGDALFW
jgi:hypothetical protein